jgi:hypothetical protein
VLDESGSFLAKAASCLQVTSVDANAMSQFVETRRLLAHSGSCTVHVEEAFETVSSGCQEAQC